MAGQKEGVVPNQGLYGTVSYKNLIAAVTALNEAFADAALKIKTVGVKREYIVETLLERIKQAIDAQQDDQLPKATMDFYNKELLPIAQVSRTTNTGQSDITKRKSDPKGKKTGTPAAAAGKSDGKKDGKKGAATQPGVPPQQPAGNGNASNKRFSFRRPSSANTPGNVAGKSAKSGNATGQAAPQGTAAGGSGGKKTGLKADSPRGGRGKGGGSGMVARAVALYCSGIRDSKQLAAAIDKEFPGTPNRSTLSHVRCILGHIPEGVVVHPKTK